MVVKITDSLLKWIRTIDGLSSVTVDELCDGVHLARVLATLLPEFFNNEWLSMIKTDIEPDNWRLRVSNLKKIRGGIMDYFSDILSISSLNPPDITAIGRDKDKEQLGKLLQLVVVCAVNCENKQKYIEVIMSLDEEVQHGVMQAIQEIINSRDREASFSMAFPDSLNNEQPQILREQIKKLNEELQLANESIELSNEKILEMEQSIKKLKIEKETLIIENERMSKLIESSGSDRNDVSDTEMQDRTNNRLQMKISTLEQALYKIEAHRDEEVAKNALLERDLFDLKLKNEDLQRKANEARELKDELDIFKHMSTKVEEYEQTIDACKNKLLDLKKQMKITEERNAELIKINLQLEGEIKKSSALRGQLEMYKKQIQELRRGIAEQSHRAEKAEFDLKSVSEKNELLAQENRNLINEINVIKIELQETRGRSDSDSILDPIARETKFLINEIDREQEEVNEDMRLQLIKLEHEKSSLTNLLKDSNKKISILQKELESQKNDFKRSKEGGFVVEDNIRRELIESKRKICELEEKLAEKEATHKKCVDMAKKSVCDLKSLTSPPLGMQIGNGPMSAPVFCNDNCFDEKREKDKRIAYLEAQLKKTSLNEIEMMTTAFHNLAGNLHRKSAVKRVSVGSLNQGSPSSGSFLSRQRQTSKVLPITGIHQN